MAYYKITIQLESGKTIQSIRELPEKDIDELWTTYEMKSSGVYRNGMNYFNMVLLSKHSYEVKEYLQKTYPPPEQPDSKKMMQYDKNKQRLNSSHGKTLGERRKDQVK